MKEEVFILINQIRITLCFQETLTSLATLSKRVFALTWTSIQIYLVVCSIKYSQFNFDVNLSVSHYVMRKDLLAWKCERTITAVYKAYELEIPQWQTDLGYSKLMIIYIMLRIYSLYSSPSKRLNFSEFSNAFAYVVRVI